MTVARATVMERCKDRAGKLAHGVLEAGRVQVLKANDGFNPFDDLNSVR